jgi:hypothetical protein
VVLWFDRALGYLLFTGATLPIYALKIDYYCNLQLDYNMETTQMAYSKAKRPKPKPKSKRPKPKSKK